MRFLFAIGQRVVRFDPMILSPNRENVPFNPVIPPDWVQELIDKAEAPPWTGEEVVLHDSHAVDD